MSASNNEDQQPVQDHSRQRTEYERGVRRKAHAEHEAQLYIDGIIDNYISTCSRDEMELFREMVAQEDEKRWPSLGPMIRASDPATSPRIRAHIFSVLSKDNTVQAVLSSLDTTLEERRVAELQRRTSEEAIIASTPAEVIQQTMKELLGRVPLDRLNLWKSQGIDPIEVRSVRAELVERLYAKQKAYAAKFEGVVKPPDQGK